MPDISMHHIPLLHTWGKYWSCKTNGSTSGDIMQTITFQLVIVIIKLKPLSIGGVILRLEELRIILGFSFFFIYVVHWVWVYFSAVAADTATRSFERMSFICAYCTKYYIVDFTVNIIL